MKSFEVITKDNKSHFVSAVSKKSVKEFWVSSKIKKIIERKDINSSENLSIN